MVCPCALWGAQIWVFITAPYVLSNTGPPGSSCSFLFKLQDLPMAIQTGTILLPHKSSVQTEHVTKESIFCRGISHLQKLDLEKIHGKPLEQRRGLLTVPYYYYHEKKDRKSTAFWGSFPMTKKLLHTCTLRKLKSMEEERNKKAFNINQVSQNCL